MSENRSPNYTTIDALPELAIHMADPKPYLTLTMSVYPELTNSTVTHYLSNLKCAHAKTKEWLRSRSIWLSLSLFLRRPLIKSPIKD